jgi:transcriptional regulator with XRE-family HTH domain
MKRGRPKGRSRDNRSFGPLGDLIRKQRLEKRLGLLDVAKACKCSVQFISNIEHGRAPLPWDKVEQLASYLKLRTEEIQAANLAIRSDFRTFVGDSKPGKKSKGISAPAASIVAYTAKDSQLRSVIEKYQAATNEARKRFVKEANRILA